MYDPPNTAKFKHELRALATEMYHEPPLEGEIYHCYLQCVTKDYTAAYIRGPSRSFTDGKYYVKLNGAYLGKRTEHGYELVTDERYIHYFEGPDAYEMAFWCKNRFNGKVIRVNELEVDYVPNEILFDDEDEEEDY